MATLDDVKRWYIDWRRITHIVASECHGWVGTCCGSLITGDSQTERPDKMRLRRKCRKRLKEATVVK